VTEAAALQRGGAWAQHARVALHHVARRVLPLTLGLRQRYARSGYERLLMAYRLDFLRQHQAFPEGVPYTLLWRQRVAPAAWAYRLRAPAGVRHEPGDVLLLRWRNADDEVQALLDRLGWRGDERLRLRGASSAFTPGRWHPVDARRALRDMIDLRAAVEAGALERPVSMPSPAQLAAWPRIQPRSYSLSAIEPGASGEEVEIVVSDAAVSGADGTSRLGRCTGHLARLRAGETLRGWPLSFPLTLQPPHATASTPLLIVATGIAAAGPLLELQHVPAQRPVWLLCGLRHADMAQAFTRRLLAAAAARPGLRLDIALSRDAAPAEARTGHWHGHCRVQDVLRAQSARLQALLEAGGDIVVIGHTSMGDALRALLREHLRSSRRAASEAEAAAQLVRLEHALRVQYSLSGR